MADDLSDWWKSLSLSETEQFAICLLEHLLLDKPFDTTQCFLFKLLTVKFVNKGDNLFLANFSLKGKK